jgi:hypothetical protein
MNGCSDPFFISSTVSLISFHHCPFIYEFLECAGSNEVPTLNTIDNYMARLHSLLLDSTTHDREALLATVRELVGRLEFHG